MAFHFSDGITVTVKMLKIGTSKRITIFVAPESFVLIAYLKEG